MPAYNQAKYIARAIDSILSQSYQNFEIIVIDDGSTDETNTIVSSYGHKVQYFYQNNSGAASARNNGIEKARSEYITFLDSDDFYLHENLTKKIRVLDDNPHIGWVYSDWQYINEKGQTLEKGSDKFKYKHKKLSGKIFEELLRNRNFIDTGTVVIRRIVLNDVGFFDPMILSQEEYDLWLRIAVKYSVSYIDEPLLRSTVHSGSLSTDFSKWVNGNVIIVEKLDSIIPDDFIDKKSVLNRMQADKFTFLAHDFILKRQYRNALKAYWQSILRLPLQKRIYWHVFLLLFRWIYYNLAASYEPKA